MMGRKRSGKPDTRRAKRACVKRQPSWIHNQGIILALWKTLVDANRGKDWLSLVSTCKELRCYAESCNNGLRAELYLLYGYKPDEYRVGVNSLKVSMCERYSSPTKIPETVTDLTVRQSQCRSASGMMQEQLVMWPNAYFPLHEGITNLVLDVKFTCTVIGWRLPSTLEELHLTCEFNQPVVGWELPRGLKVLNLGHRFNQPVVGWDLPESLTKIRFGESFNQEVEGLVLPQGIGELGLLGKFNKPVSRLKLPEFLKILEFGNDFNQPLGEMKLPPRLNALIFGNSFNQVVEQLEIPSTATFIRFGMAFKQPIAKLNFPDDMTELWLRDACYNFKKGCIFQSFFFGLMGLATELTPETVSDPRVLDTTVFKKYWKRVEHNLV